MKENGFQLTVRLSTLLKRELIPYCLLHFENIDLLFETFFTSVLEDQIEFFIEMKRIGLTKQLGIPLNMCSKELITVIFKLLELHYKDPLFQVNIGLQGYTLQYSHFKYNALLDQNISRIGLLKTLSKHLQNLVPRENNNIKELIRSQLTQSIQAITIENHPLKKKLQRMLEKT